jgi:hypothetical protein
MESNQNNFKDRVLHSIEEQNVQTYSKAHFRLRVVLLVALAVLTLMVSVFFFSLVFFDLRFSGRGALLGFGPQGFFLFLRTFPWLLLTFDVILIAVLEWLLRKFRFGYRTPVLYLLIVLLAIAISVGFVIDRNTAFNDALIKQADAHHLPSPFRELYENERGLPPGGICKCLVTAVTSSTVTAVDVNRGVTTTLTIVLPPNYVATNILKVGDVIFVAGNRMASNTIQVFGVTRFQHLESGQFNVMMP